MCHAYGAFQHELGEILPALSAAEAEYRLCDLCYPAQLAGLAQTPLVWAWNGWAFVACLLAYGYATVMCWLLIHEAIHYKLLRNRHANDRLGRVLAVLFGCPFHILKVGHMTHHRYNRGK